MTKKVFRLTRAGIQKLQTQQTELSAVRKTLLEDLKTARGQGDLSENSEYTAARLALEQVQNKLAELEEILEHAEPLPITRTSSKVRVGNVVHLRLTDGNLRHLQLVSTIEADPLHDKISDESPLGKVLLGKAQGDEVTLQTPSKKMVCTIVAIA